MNDVTAPEPIADEASPAVADAAPADAQPAAEASADAGVLGAEPAAAPAAPDDGADDASGNADKPAADADAAKPEGEADAPKAYEGLAAPEGFESIDTDALTAATPLMRKFGVPDDQAQDFINEAAPVISGMVAKAVTAHAEGERAKAETQSAAWAEEIKADPEFGGANFDRTVARAGLVLDKFFGADTRALLTAYSIGNHPELVRGFAKLGEHFAEGDVTPGAPAAVAKGHPLYGDSFLPPEQRKA